MKQILFISIILIISLKQNFAQDIISLKKGGEIKSKVVEIDQEYIKYKRFDNLQGPTIWISKEDVVLITYENGTKETIEYIPPVVEKTVEPTAPSISESGNFYLDGQLDANKHYSGKNSGAIGTLIVSLISPIVGLLPATITSASTPMVENLNVPKPQLLSNREYMKGYQSKAKRIKQRNIWSNWGIAFGVNLIAAAVLLNK